MKETRERLREPHTPCNSKTATKDGDGHIEYVEGERGSEVHHFVHEQHVRTEYAKGHPYHGWVEHLVNGKTVRTEYEEGL